MNREEKLNIIEDLTAKLADNSIIYLTDISGLDAEATSNLRRACFKANIKLTVVKNTLLEKAMDGYLNVIQFQHKKLTQEQELREETVQRLQEQIRQLQAEINSLKTDSATP